jgi:hypothetical protein
MEKALNDWLCKVEEQVNSIEDQLANRAHKIDLKSLEQRLFNDDANQQAKLK